MTKPLSQNAHTLTGLIKLSRRLRGEIEKLQREQRELLARITTLHSEEERRAKQLEQVDGTIQTMDPSTEPSLFIPIETTHRIAWLPHGALRRLVLEVLKDATSPMTAREIHDTIVERAEIQFPDDEVRAKHRQKLREAVHNMYKKNPGVIEPMEKLPMSSYVGVAQRGQLGPLLR